jgi:hypothetical protein
MLPVGKYEAVAVQAMLGVAETGTELVAIQFRILTEGHADELITYRGYFTEKTSKRVIESLRHCGWKGDWETWEGLTDNHIQLDIQEDSDMKTGEIRGTRVAWVNPVQSFGLKNNMDAVQRKSFSARMKGLVTEVLSSNGQRPQAAKTNGAARPVATPAAAAVEEDSVPF